MPITRHFLEKKNFVLTRINGAVDENELRRHLEAMNEEAAPFSALTELVDCREAQCTGCRSMQELVEIASLEIGRSWAVGGRLAIVVGRPAAFGVARAYLVGSETVRKDVHVTYSWPEALHRLDLDPEIRAFVSFC